MLQNAVPGLYSFCLWYILNNELKYREILDSWNCYLETAVDIFIYYLIPVPKNHDIDYIIDKCCNFIIREYPEPTFRNKIVSMPVYHMVSSRIIKLCETL